MLRLLSWVLGFYLSLVTSTSVWGGHGPHEHGKAQLNVAIDGKTAKIVLWAPAGSIYGFEYEAKTPKDIKIRDAAVEKLKTQMDQMVIFDVKAACAMTNTNLQPFVAHRDTHEHKAAGKEKKLTGDHGDVEAEYFVQCQGDPLGGDIKLALWKFFPKIEKVVVQTLTAKGAQSSEVTPKKSVVGFPK